MSDSDRHLTNKVWCSVAIHQRMSAMTGSALQLAQPAAAEGGEWRQPSHVVWNHVSIVKPANGINTFHVQCKHCSWGKPRPVVVNTTKLKFHFNPPEGSQVCMSVC